MRHTLRRVNLARHIAPAEQLRYFFHHNISDFLKKAGQTLCQSITITKKMCTTSADDGSKQSTHTRCSFIFPYPYEGHLSFYQLLRITSDYFEASQRSRRDDDSKTLSEVYARTTYGRRNTRQTQSFFSSFIAKQAEHVTL